MFKKILLIFVVTFFTEVAISAEVDLNKVAKIVQLAKENGLSQQAHWLALLHYQRKNEKNANVSDSEILSKDFFLSAEGNKNPFAELKASIEGFYAKAGVDDDQHAKCRFPARYSWINQSLKGILSDTPKVECKKFKEWSMSGKIDSLSLIFVTGYLENPASVYGHILLKFNSSTVSGEGNLLDQSINFGAQVPENENAIVYITKGMLGGYHSSFSDTKFYRQNHIYIENELRDMWEYELNLPQASVDYIVAHSWELMGQTFDYYFLKKNCAYRMAELLELVIDKPLFTEGFPWTIPSDIFEHLMSVNKGSLIKSVKYIPSRQSRYYQKYLALTQAEKEIVIFLVNHNLNFNSDEYKKVKATGKVKIVDCLIDYYAFNELNKDKKIQAIQYKHRLLLERLALVQSKANKVVEYNYAIPPHNGPLPSVIRLSGVVNDQLGSGVSFRYRPVYYDLIGLTANHYSHSNLTMIDAEVVVFKDRVKIKKIDLFNVQSLKLAVTDLPEDFISWQANMSYGNQNLGCYDCKSLRLTGGIGRALSLYDKNYFYFMLEAYAQNKVAAYDSTAAYGVFSIVASPSRIWKMEMKYKKKVYSNATDELVNVFSWENRFGMSRDWDIRLSIEHNVVEEIKLGLSLYW